MLNRFQILYEARQYQCRALRKICKRLRNPNWCYEPNFRRCEFKMSFGSIPSIVAVNRFVESNAYIPGMNFATSPATSLYHLINLDQQKCWWITFINQFFVGWWFIFPCKLLESFLLSPIWQLVIIYLVSGVLIIPPPNTVGGGRVYWMHLVRPSVRPSVDDMVSGAYVKFALEFQFPISYACWWWS